MKKDIKFFLFALLFGWVAITNAVQAMKCPKMTNTELLVHIPKSFILDFKTCK